MFPTVREPVAFFLMSTSVIVVPVDGCSFYRRGLAHDNFQRSERARGWQGQ
jgi:hypothetical protein